MLVSYKLIHSFLMSSDIEHLHVLIWYSFDEYYFIFGLFLFYFLTFIYISHKNKNNKKKNQLYLHLTVHICVCVHTHMCLNMLKYVYNVWEELELAIPKIHPDFDIICVKTIRKLCLDGQLLYSLYKHLECWCN